MKNLKKRYLIILSSTLFILLGLVGLFIYEYVRVKPNDVHFSNVTSSSVTVSWNTKSPTSASVIAFEGDTFLPVGLLCPTNERFFDTRDGTRAELEAAEGTAKNIAEDKDLTVTMDEFVTEIKVEKRGDYYTHHVTVIGLDPETEYSFMVGDKYLYRKAENSEGNATVTSLAIPEEIKSPYPAYGSVKDANNQEDVAFEDLINVTDGIVYFNYLDEFSGEKSTVYSSSLNSDGGWYIDVSNAVGEDGERFLDRFDDTVTNILVELIIDVGPLGRWEKVVDYSTISPTEVIVINDPMIIQDEELGVARIDAFIMDSVVSGVEASGCMFAGFCGPCCEFKEAGGACESCACDSGTLESRNCEGQPVQSLQSQLQENASQAAAQAVGNASCSGGVAHNSYACSSSTQCVRCNNGLFTSNGVTREDCAGKPCGTSGAGSIVQCGDNKCEGTETFTNCSQDCYKDEACKNKLGGTDCGSGKICDGEGSCITATGGAGGGTCEGRQVENCNNSCSWYACDNECWPTGTPIQVACPGDCEGRKIENCNNGCSWYACDNDCWPTGTPTIEACPSVEIGGNNDESGPISCKPSITFMKPCITLAGEAGQCSMAGACFKEGAQCVMAGEENRLGNYNSIGTCVASFIGTTIEQAIPFRVGGQVCNTSYPCLCKSQNRILPTPIVGGGTWCPHVRGDNACQGSTDGLICKVSQDKYVCKNGDCVLESSIQEAKMNNLELDILGKSIISQVNASSYVFDKSTGIISSIESGTYVFEYDGEMYAFVVSENADDIIIYLDVNGNSSYDEDVDVLLTEFASMIEITPIKKTYKYELKKGINFISLPFIIPEEGLQTAGGLLKEINNLYSDSVFSISKFNGGKWKMVGQNVELYGNDDFQLLPGEGYIIKAKEDVNISIVGQPVKFESEDDSAPINLNTGWNLIGLYGTGIKTYTAKILIQDINTNNFTSDNVTKWAKDKQMYEGFQMTDGEEYGFDYPLNQLESYFVRITEGKGNWQPELSGNN